MMKKEIGICVRKEKSFDVAQKGYDNAAAHSIVNTQVIQGMVGDVVQKGCVSSYHTSDLHLHRAEGRKETAKDAMIESWLETQ